MPSPYQNNPSVGLDSANAIRAPHLNQKIVLNRTIFAMGSESAGAGSRFATAVYKTGK